MKHNWSWVALPVFAIATSISSLGSNLGFAKEPIAVQMANDVTLSPDGSLLAFRWANEIWTVPTAGGDAKRLTNHPARDGDPKFSPDGKRIAFVSNRTGSNQIFIMPADGGLAVQKTYHSEGYSLADWFPDGNSVLALGSRDHFWRGPSRMMKIDITKRTAEDVLLDDAASYASLSSDGKSILFVREGERWARKGYVGERAAQIWSLDLETSEVKELLHEKVECLWPIWMPNKTGFYFTKGANKGHDLWSYQFGVDGQPAQQTKLAGFDHDSIVYPVISRDGSTIVFRHLFDLYSYKPGSGQAPSKLDIKIAADNDLPDDVLRANLTRADDVSFTDDGLEIAMTAGGDLWFMDTELKEPVRATKTDGHEQVPVFSNDGKSLWFTRWTEGQIDIWMMERKDPNLYWWQQKEFVETRITNTPSSKTNLSFTPDGKKLLFQSGRGNLAALNVETKEVTTLLEGFSEIDYSISPDSNWIAFAKEDNDFNSEIFIMPLDKHQPPVNVSRHPDNDRNPVFSPDGKLLAFTGRRAQMESDIYYVYLQEAYDEETNRDRLLEKALETMKKKRGAAKPASEGAKPDESNKAKEEGDKPKEDAVKKDDAAKKEDAGKEDKKPFAIDFNKIHERVKRINVPDTAESNLVFSPDGKRLAFSASVEGKAGWYSVEFPDKLQPKLMSTSVLSNAKWTKASNSILGAKGGLPTRLENGEKETSYSFTALHERSRSGRLREGFNSAWATMGEIWYDPAMGNNNWDSIRRKYVDAAAKSLDERGLGEIVELMLGELNGSHLGFTPAQLESSETSSPSRSDQPTAHLGARFDPKYLGPGLKVRDVLPSGPTDKSKSRLQAGDIILMIDGTKVDPALDLTEIFNGPVDRDIQLLVQRKNEADGQVKEMQFSVRPVTYARVRALLYDHWLEYNRNLVEKLSDGTLGYLHIRAMDESSFLEFEKQLYNVGYGKDGLVIDVRDNGGGSTTDHLLTSLTQPKHSITVPRGGGEGYPHDRMIYATWSKPIIVLCNQNSYSNAEIFSHAIKALGRGKLVGVQTAGGVVSTGSARVTDIGVVRAPFRGWFSILDGRDMELNGALPDVVIWPVPGEMPAGVDKQLEKAVELLKEDVKLAPQTPKPKYATQDRGSPNP
jgi:tricorn protease